MGNLFQQFVSHHVGAASARLQDDWEWTGGQIYTADAIPGEGDTYVYLASCWAISEIDLDGDVEDCWTWMDETDWDEKTFWPPEARRILFGNYIDAEPGGISPGEGAR